MEKENIIELLEEKANNGDINSKIVLILNKINRKYRRRNRKTN